MDPVMFAVLFSATAVNAALPGPCTILTASRSGVAGQAAGMRITLGVLLANLILVTITLAVMHGALTVSDQAFGIMKWGGIVVLLAMGGGCCCRNPPTCPRHAPRMACRRQAPV